MDINIMLGIVTFLFGLSLFLIFYFPKLNKPNTVELLPPVNGVKRVKVNDKIYYDGGRKYRQFDDTWDHFGYQAWLDENGREINSHFINDCIYQHEQELKRLDFVKKIKS